MNDDNLEDVDDDEDDEDGNGDGRIKRSTLSIFDVKNVFDIFAGRRAARVKLISECRT